MAAVLGGLRAGCRLDGIDVMGMSPACHCICPGPPGPGSSSSTIETIGNCTRCTGGLAPRRWRLDSSGATGTCASHYNGSFILTDNGACRWFSAEKEINLLGFGTCPLGGAERWILVTETLAGPTRYRFNLGHNILGNLCVLGTAFVSAAVNDPTKLDCLTSHTLTATTAYQWAGGLGCGGPRFVGPTVVTITPI